MFMSYNDIIKEQASLLEKDIKWWPYFFFHYTHVENAVGVLKEECVYSRDAAIEKGLMASENASQKVLSVTDEDVFRYARLYFRPKTPTQFRNEGYKPEVLRDSTVGASCPVPIFFLLLADKVLQQDRVYFVEKGLAGHGHMKTAGEEGFSGLDFSKIFHNKRYDKAKEAYIKDFRQSEIVRLYSLPIEDSLYRVICRSQAERETLLFLLKLESDDLYERFKNIIMYEPRADLFFNNGIFISKVSWNGSALEIDFNDRCQRERKQALIKATIHICYEDGCGTVLEKQIIEREFDFIDAAGLEFPLAIENSVRKMRVRILFDDALMYYNCLDLEDEILF